MPKRILIITGDAGEGYETLYAYHRFLEAGHHAVIAAKAKRRLHLVIHDFEPGWDTYVERPGYTIEAHADFSHVQADDFDAVLIIGGRAPEYLRHDTRVIELVRAFAAAGKWLFAICHGIQVLVAAGVVKDRSVTCYEHVKLEVELAGGHWQSPQAVRDGNMITAQTWESHPEFYREIFACIEA